jgi:hypothetical protein
VHLVDPFPPGPGRVWRFAQSPLLRMNSMPEDVTMFTDDTVRCEGPVRPGPTLAEWVDAARAGELTVDPALSAELAAVTATTFPTRRLQSAYLDWFFTTVTAALPSKVELYVHRASVLDVTGPPDGVQSLRLTGGASLTADVVVLALGHLDAAPDPAAVFAAPGLRHVPPAYTADLDLSGIRAGEPVLVRGFGLAFVDLAVLLTEGRGGRFTPSPDGSLTYHPSGAEPVLHVGSRRGVPYHAKPEYRLVGTPAGLPRFFTAAALSGPLDFRADVWPLMAKDIGWGYYHELFTGHPERVRMDLDEFADRYAELAWDSTELRCLVAKAVPEERDRLDLAALDRPLAGLRFTDRAALTAHVLGHVEADLARRADVSFSADLGAFHALLAVFGQLAQLVGRFNPASQVDDVDGWWFGFFSFYASGPPGHRLRELIALCRAGVVRLVGPDMWVRVERDRFVAGSPAVPDTVEATTLVDARLPVPSLSRATDPLLRTLHRRGELTEEVLAGERTTGRIRTTVDSHPVGADGRAHPRRFAIGPHTSSRSPGAFTRPRTNAPGFRQNDAVARQILTQLKGTR